MVENHVVAPPASEQTIYPMIYQTQPERLSWHVIEDHQLSQLTNVSRPVVLGLTTTFLGAAVGLLIPAVSAWERYGPTHVLSMTDLATIIAFCCSVVATLFLGVFAVRGQLDAVSLVSEIRNRRSTQVSPQHSSAVPGASIPTASRTSRRRKA